MKQVYLNYKSQYIYSYIVYGIDGCFIWKKIKKYKLLYFFNICICIYQ